MSVDIEQLVEPMGSKKKFWYRDSSGNLSLFKATRVDTGEDWAEKIAEVIADRLGLPHAVYQLAYWQGQRGVVTPRITNSDETLIHGNELLVELVDQYETTKRYRTPQHTVSTVVNALHTDGVGPPRGWETSSEVSTAVDVLAGYLLLDTVIGNTDRHHENWAVITQTATASSLTLAPTFDHASSLGRNEPINRMADRLRSKDEGFSVEAYAARARSALYGAPEDSRPLTTLEAFSRISNHAPAAAAAWRSRLSLLDDTFISEAVAAVPSRFMEKIQKEFVRRIITCNRDRALMVGSLR